MMNKFSSESGGIGKGIAVLVVMIMLAFAACFAISDDKNESSMRTTSYQLSHHDEDDKEREGGTDSRCKDGRCCVGVIAMCDNTFPIPLPGQQEDK